MSNVIHLRDGRHVDHGGTDHSPRERLTIPRWIFFHRSRIGEAVWLLLDLIDRVTMETMTQGEAWGIVLGGKCLKIWEVTGEPRRSAFRYLQVLKRYDYVRTIKSRYGIIIFVKGPKFGSDRWVERLPVEPPASQEWPGSPEVPNLARLEGPEVPNLARLEGCISIGDLKEETIKRAPAREKQEPGQNQGVREEKMKDVVTDWGEFLDWLREEQGEAVMAAFLAGVKPRWGADEVLELVNPSAFNYLAENGRRARLQGYLEKAFGVELAGVRIVKA